MEDYLAISALQHYAYCPRQFALIHVEQAWAENRLTAEGRVLHGRVDSGEPEQRRGVRFERSVSLVSHAHGLIGKTDLLETETSESGVPRYFPVEYKKGKPKVEDWDRLQLCAQALCIEEMRGIEVDEGAIWYWEVRRREPICIDEALRDQTLAVITRAKSLLREGKTPEPVNDSRCRACSLVELCSPATFACDRTGGYLDELFSESGGSDEGKR